MNITQVSKQMEEYHKDQDTLSAILDDIINTNTEYTERIKDLIASENSSASSNAFRIYKDLSLTIRNLKSVRIY